MGGRHRRGRHRAPRVLPLRPALAAAAVAAALLTTVAALGVGPAAVQDEPLPRPALPRLVDPPRRMLIPAPPTGEIGAAAAAAVAAREAERPRRRTSSRPAPTTTPPRPAPTSTRPAPVVRDEPAAPRRTPAPAPTRPPAPAPPPPAPPPAVARPCPTTLAGVRPHAAQAGHHIAQRFGISLGSILGLGSRGNPTSLHPRGLALDFMVDRATGDRIADYALAHMAELGIREVIWRQRYNDGSGWDPMPDRGSATANHHDHVHIGFGSGAGSGLPC